MYNTKKNVDQGLEFKH